MESYDMHEEWEQGQEKVRNLARRRKTLRHLSVTASWWPSTTDSGFSASYHTSLQLGTGEKVHTEYTGYWPEACDDQMCHVMSGLVLACDWYLSSGHGPNGTEKHPTPRGDRAHWEAFLTGEAAAQARLAAKPTGILGRWDSRGAGVSVTEFDRFGTDMPQTEVLFHRLERPSRQWTPVQIGLGTDATCDHVWCLMSALNDCASGWMHAHDLYPAHAEAVGRLLEEGAPLD